MHGLIRTGHAARSLSVRETPARRHELAEGLAYWAARYQELPDRRTPPKPGGLPSKAIDSVPRLPDDGHPHNGSIAQAFHRLDRFDLFAGVADLVDPSVETSLFLSDLTATFARVYVRQTSRPGPFIGFLHGVTAPGAIRLLVPHVGPEARRSLLRHGWQAAAGLQSAMSFASSEVGEAREAAAPAVSAAPEKDAGDLVERAIATGDEHAMKFTECCLRENAIQPDPAYMKAARDAVGRLG